MIKVTLEFNDVFETIDALNRLTAAPATALAAPPMQAPAVPVAPGAGQEPAAAVTPPAARRGRPPKTGDAGVPPAVAPAGTPAPQEPASPAPVPASPKLPNQPVQIRVNTGGLPPFSTDELRPMLKAVFDKKGAKTATELLKQFSVARISDVKSEQSRAFAGACEAALKV
jgi:hypothetical protein